jgi:hypothetical protein
MGKVDVSRSDPPPPKRTLPLGTVDPRDVGSTATDGAGHARALIAELEQAIASEDEGSAQFARIERAWSAWSLGGMSDETIQHVAHLVARAYEALHEAPRRKPSRKSSGLAASSCAHVLHNGLPPAVKSRVDFSDVLAIVHELERAIEQWPAVIKATAELLGWNRAALAHAGRAIKGALSKKNETVG